MLNSLPRGECFDLCPLVVVLVPISTGDHGNKYWSFKRYHSAIISNKNQHFDTLCHETWTKFTKRKKTIRLWCVFGSSSIFDSYNYFDISINVTEKDLISKAWTFSLQNQESSSNRIYSKCSLVVLFLSVNSSLIARLFLASQQEKNDYHFLKCIWIINYHPVLHNTSHFVLKVYCPSFILHQESYNNFVSKSFSSIFSSSCVTLQTEWTWVSYRAPRTVGLLPVGCWKEQPVAFCTFTRTLPHRYRTRQPFQQSMMSPTGFLGRQATERCGRPGLMTRQTASALF